MKRRVCRLIEESDVEAVAAIYKVAFAPSSSEVNLTRERIGNERRGAVVALEGETVVGMIFFNFYEEEKRKVLLLDRVAVSKLDRRSGIATKMINWLVEHAAKFDYKYACLMVNAGNTPAFNCYKRCGFSLHDSRKTPDHFEDPLLLRMERPKTL